MPHYGRNRNIFSLWQKQKNAGKKGGSSSNRGYQGSRNRKKLKPGSLVLLKTYGSMLILFWEYRSSIKKFLWRRTVLHILKSWIIFYGCCLTGGGTLDLGSWVRNNNKFNLSCDPLQDSSPAPPHGWSRVQRADFWEDSNTTHSYPPLTTVKPLLSGPPIKRTPSIVDTKPGPEMNVWYFLYNEPFRWQLY